ncbi:putative siderophore iron transporter mirB [Xylariaceae sp. FL0804]|nr:putative siderophore iron transporter mirB [Xylariaceae sp. FL0804]
MDDRTADKTPLLRVTSIPEHEHDEQTVSYGAAPTKSDSAVLIEDTSQGPKYDGVRQADAVNLVWSKAALVTAYLFIFLCSFANALQWQVMSNLMPYVVSEFKSHSLIPTIGIVASILSGVLKLPVARVIDTWGRPRGLAATIALATGGLALMAACRDVASYAAAQVLYQVGISGFSYTLDIVVADTSSLRNRSLAFAFSSSPYLVTTFLGPPIAAAFHERSSWRWAFGGSAVLFFLLSLPVLALLAVNTRRARAMGLLAPSAPAGSSWTVQGFRRALSDFDALGLTLITSAMTLILVPFSMSSTTEKSQICSSHAVLIALGTLLMVAFVLHERKVEKPFLDFSLLCSRNVAGACLLSVTIFVAYFSWDGYYTSYLQVVHDLSITQAGYVGHIYSIGSAVWSIVVGYLIRRTDRFKWLAVAALPLHIAGGALLIAFRRPDTDITWVVLCQVLMTVGGSTLVVCEQMAVMAVASHAELASVMALLSLASYVGSAVGSALSGAIWNATLPAALAELLPALAPAELSAIASDLAKQLSYPMGSPVRDAIVTAYGRSQVRMCVAGTLVSLVEIVAVMMWKDVRVSQSRQVKGTVL